MSDVPLLEPIDDSDEELDERIMALRATGMSLPRISRHLLIPLHVLHRRIQALLPVVDASYRRIAIAESLVQIDQIIGKHTLTIGDPESASLVIRAICEKRALLGLTGSNYDPVQLQARPNEHSISPITRGLDLIEQLRRLTNEKPSEQPSDPDNPDKPDDPGAS